MPTTPPVIERIPTEVFAEHVHLAGAIARRIADLIRRRQAEGRRAVLGLATGSTPIGVYRELIRLHREEGLSFRDVTAFNLDEYDPMPPDSPHSYRRFMRENLFDHIDIDPAATHIPAGDCPRPDVESMCAGYEDAIRAAGGIDHQILGL
jgi:glucosamine-6-phosphate deaminase